MSDAQRTAGPSRWDILARADVLSGLLFVAIAAFGLWASRNYPVGTALRMAPATCRVSCVGCCWASASLC